MRLKSAREIHGLPAVGHVGNDREIVTLHGEGEGRYLDWSGQKFFTAEAFAKRMQPLPTTLDVEL